MDGISAFHVQIWIKLDSVVCTVNNADLILSSTAIKYFNFLFNSTIMTMQPWNIVKSTSNCDFMDECVAHGHNNGWSTSLNAYSFKPFLFVSI